MRVWYIVAGLLGIGLVYVLIKRPVVPVGTATQAPGSNDLFRAIGSLASLGTAIVGKVSAPSSTGSAADPALSSSNAVYQPGDSFDTYATGLFGPGTNVQA